MKKILFVLTCLFCSVAMMASITVTGTVISAEDGLPVIGASAEMTVPVTVMLAIIAAEQNKQVNTKSIFFINIRY